MARRVFLHIGRAKTGSTAIQRALATNRRLLRVYDYAFPGRGLDHSEILPDLSGSVADSFLEEVRACPGDAIISTEGLQNSDPTRAREWLAGFDVRVIVYLREQASMLASGWAQVVHGHLETCSLEEYIRHAGVVDYCNFLKPWADAFGKSNLIVRVYDRRLFPKGDVVADFLRVVGLPPLEPFFLDHLVDSNPTLSGDLLEAKRQINAGWTRSEEELRELIYAPLMMLAMTNKDWRGHKLDPALVAAVREKHRVCNARLAREYLGCEIAFPSHSPGPAKETPQPDDATLVRLPVANRAG